ncbi:trypsin-7-like [Euwallacea similis]|uniref:trypsin-7-like n=1 Tax=Euwallacea similis TaxID=1736056 RepID=UPI00344CF23F
MMKCFKCHCVIFMSLVVICNSIPRYFDRHRIFRLNYENPLRIIGGSPANIEDYPYQVLLMIDDLPNCGGSIIQENFVLTAAHCIYDVDPHHLTIRAGSANRTTGGQVVRITSVYYPDSFNIDTYDYDVAILKLETPLVLNEQVGTINLPSPDYDIEQGEIAIATGWGQTDPDDSTLPVILQKVELPEIVTQTCRNYYGSLITNRMFCAGYKEGGKDTCSGDSGGPLTANGYQLGITSWGSDRCAQSGSPGVFTKVAYFREYIDDILNSVDHSKVIFNE